MKLKFNGSEGFSEYQLTEIEKLLSRDLPSYLKEFLLQYGGSKPSINNKNCGLAITLFDGSKISGYIEKIVSYGSLQNDLQYIGYLEEYAEYSILARTTLKLNIYFLLQR